MAAPEADPDQLSEQIEQADFDFLWAYSDLYGALRNALAARGKEQDAANIVFEFELFRETKTRAEQDAAKSGRFTPALDKASFTKEQILHLENRALKFRNPRLKAYYFDVLWEIGGGPDKQGILARQTVGTQAIIALLTLARLSALGTGRERLALHSLDRAYDIALKMGDAELIDRCAREFQDVVMSLANVKPPNYFLLLSFSKILETNLRHRKASNIDREFVEPFYGFLDVGRQQCLDTKDYFGHQEFVNALLKYADFVGVNAEQVHQLRLEHCRSFELEAEYQQGRAQKQAMVAARFYENAFSCYSEMGEPDKAKEMKRKMEESQLAAQGEMKTIRISIPINAQEKHATDEFNSTLLKPTSLDECLRLIGRHPAMRPPLGQLKAQAQQILGDSIMRILSVRVTSRATSQSLTSEAEKLDLQTAQGFSTWLMLNYSLHLRPLFELLKTDKGLSAPTLFKCLKKWPLLPEDQAPFIERGIERYFEQDYISAVFILTPQFEGLLRHMIFESGEPVTKLKQGRGQYETVYSFIDSEEVKRVLEDENLHYYMKTVLVSQLGPNLRGRVAHALITGSECNQPHAEVLIFFLLALATLPSTKIVVPSGSP